jgi:hypothetical protein
MLRTIHEDYSFGVSLLSRMPPQAAVQPLTLHVSTSACDSLFGAQGQGRIDAGGAGSGPEGCEHGHGQQ